ncbi:MAG TPA: cyclic nucleotide-binding domain-containing protein [Anaeromyxobacteraceae bacterium]|nr:cyclic nucleotide-binding domain-containing protein [Anaeromyxobacteraceae bacterium]
MTVVEALQRCSLFKDFTETGLKIFSTIAVEKAIPAGAPLFVENMMGESLFILKAGTVRITQRDGSGERELAVLGAGEHLGAVALLGRSTRLVSAVAATPCEVLEIAQRDFLRLQPQKPQACLKLAVAIAADLAAKVADTREALRDLGARKPAGG